MKRDFLKELELDDELINKIMAEHGKSVQKANEKEEELKLVKAQLEEKDSTIEKLSADVENIDEWKTKAEQIKAESAAKEEEYQTKVSNITKKAEFEKLLINNNVHKDSQDLLVDKYLNDVELDGERIKDADALIGKIKEERSGLFIETKETSTDKDEKHTNATKLNPFEQVFKG